MNNIVYLLIQISELPPLFHRALASSELERRIRLVLLGFVLGRFLREIHAEPIRRRMRPEILPALSDA